MLMILAGICIVLHCFCNDIKMVSGNSPTWQKNMKKAVYNLFKCLLRQIQVTPFIHIMSSVKVLLMALNLSGLVYITLYRLFYCFFQNWRPHQSLACMWWLSWLLHEYFRVSILHHSDCQIVSLRCQKAWD